MARTVTRAVASLSQLNLRTGVSYYLLMPNYEEEDRSLIEGFMKDHLSDIPTVDDAVLVSGIVIAEFITPSGRRFLARTPIGSVTQWQVQGWCYSTMQDQEWSINQDDDEDDEFSDEQ